MEGKGKDACVYQQFYDPAFVSSIQAAAYDDSTADEIPPVAPSPSVPVTPSPHPPAPNPPSSVSLRRVTRAIEAAGNEELPSTVSSPAAEARFILLAFLDVVTSAINSSLDLATLQDAMYFALRNDVDDPYHQVLENAVQVEDFSSGVDEMFAHMYPEELGEEGGFMFKERRRLRRSVREEAAAEAVTEVEAEDEEVTLQLRRYKVILTSTSKPKVRRALCALGVRDPAREASRHFNTVEGNGREDEETGQMPTAQLASDVIAYLRTHGSDQRGERRHDF